MKHAAGLADVDDHGPPEFAGQRGQTGPHKPFFRHNARRHVNERNPAVNVAPHHKDVPLADMAGIFPRIGHQHAAIDAAPACRFAAAQQRRGELITLLMQHIMQRRRRHINNIAQLQQIEIAFRRAQPGKGLRFFQQPFQLHGQIRQLTQRVVIQNRVRGIVETPGRDLVRFGAGDVHGIHGQQRIFHILRQPRTGINMQIAADGQRVRGMSDTAHAAFLHRHAGHADARAAVGQTARAAVNERLGLLFARQRRMEGGQHFIVRGVQAHGRPPDEQTGIAFAADFRSRPETPAQQKLHALLRTLGAQLTHTLQEGSGHVFRQGHAFHQFAQTFRKFGQMLRGVAARSLHSPAEFFL